MATLQAAQSNAQKKPAKKGDEFAETYSVGATTIRFENTVSSACPGGSGCCEVIVFDSIMTLNTGSCTVEVKNLIGDCGCLVAGRVLWSMALVGEFIGG